MSSGVPALVRRADADAGDVGLAGEGDDGDAHPEGFAGGGGAVVGEGVQGDGDLVVALEMLGGGGLPGEEFEAVGGDTLGGEEGAEALLNGEGGQCTGP